MTRDDQQTRNTWIMDGENVLNRS